MLRTAPALSALARQTMRAAFEDLERTINPADAREMRSVTAVEQVRASALQIENQMAARQSLRNLRRLVPLLTGLEHYQKVMDRVCQGVPFLSWAWSPISLILRVASEYVEAFEHIMKGYTKIADALGRFGILGDAFHGDADFQQMLAIFYVDILKFHKHAYKFVRRSGWKLLFLTSWGRFGRRFDNILQDLNRHGDLIDNESNARNIAEARQMRQDIRAWREESLEEVRRDDENETSKQYLAILPWLKIDEMEQTSIFESIFEEGTKFSSTSVWLLKNEKISAWLRRKPDPALLLLQGNPGSGKSVISAHLVNFLHASKSPVVHHFCTYAYASSTKYDGILKSLLLQILRQNGDLIAHVYQEYVLNRKLPSTANLEKLLRTHVASFSDEPRQPEYLWIVLDGVNECETTRQARLISLMKQISSSSAGGTILKVLISTRSSSTMGKLLGNKQAISLSDETSSLEVAIRNYAAGRLRSLQERLRQLELESEEIEEIEHLVAKKAEGMFLYARLVLDYISANIFYSGYELKEAISQLPPTLADFYHKLLTSIVARMDAQSRDRVKSTFAWVAFAHRPLKKLEFLSALAFSSGNPNTTKLAPRYIIEDICSPLIEERRDTTLAFIHISVKDFLQSSSSPLVLTKPEALQEHGVAAVTCLLSGLQVFDDKFNEQERLLRLIKGVHTFHVYATEYWAEYLLESATALGGLDNSSSLLTLAYRLAESLEESGQLQYSADALDERLSHLQQHSLLYKHISWALNVRSQKRMEARVFQESSKKNSDPSAIMDGISIMLDSYQRAIETLLNLESCPGASAEELDVFKKQFRTSAFTCRLRFCPRATIGFHTDQLRREHETIHAGGIRCTILGCQYPPFRSPQALKAHMQRYHSIEPERKSIRRIGGIDFKNLSASVTVEGKVDNNRLGLAEERISGMPNGNNRASPFLSAVGNSTPPKKKLSLSAYTSRRAKLASSQSSIASVSQNPSSTTFTPPLGPMSANETIDEEDSIIKCICGFSADDGNIVLCEKCDTWQHILCYYESPALVPKVHECVDCLPRLLDINLAAVLQRKRLDLHSSNKRRVQPWRSPRISLFSVTEATDSRKRALTDDSPDGAAPPPTVAPTSHRGRKQSLTEDPSKTFVCTLCDRRFRRQGHLKRHYRALHTHGKPFECTHCGKKFYRSSNLAQDQRSHEISPPSTPSGQQEGPSSTTAVLGETVSDPILRNDFNWAFFGDGF